MRRRALVLLLVLPLLAVGADVFDCPYTGDVDALREISGDYTLSPAVSLFTQAKTPARLKRSLVSSGVFLMKPGEGMVWVTEKPYEAVLFAGKDSVRQRTGQGKVSSVDVSSNQIYLSIAQAIESLVLGDYGKASETFDLYLEEDGGTWQIGFKPKEPLLASYLENVVVSMSEGQMESVLMREVSGNSILYSFQGLERRELTEDEETFFAL